MNGIIHLVQFPVDWAPTSELVDHGSQSGWVICLG